MAADSPSGLGFSGAILELALQWLGWSDDGHVKALAADDFGVKPAGCHTSDPRACRPSTRRVRG